MYETHINYKNLKNIIGHKKWSEYIYNLHPTADENNWCKTEEEWERWMTRCINNGRMSDGTEMIGMLLNDKRFDDYDKYVIGVGGVNEMFNVTPIYTWSAWEEQFLISKYIKSGKLKWLPEHVDVLYDELQTGISETGMNLCEFETYYKKEIPRVSRIKLYNKETGITEAIK